MNGQSPGTGTRDENFTSRNARLDWIDDTPASLAQHVLDEFRVRVEIGRDDLQDVVGRAGDLVAGRHFVVTPHHVLEVIGILAGMHVERHLHEREHVHAERAPVEVRLVAGDHAFVLEPLAAAPARRDAQRQLLAERRVRQRAVVLQQAQHGAVDAIQFGRSAIFAHFRESVGGFLKIVRNARVESKAIADCRQ